MNVDPRVGRAHNTLFKAQSTGSIPFGEQASRNRYRTSFGCMQGFKDVDWFNRCVLGEINAAYADCYFVVLQDRHQQDIFGNLAEIQWLTRSDQSKSARIYSVVVDRFSASKNQYINLLRRFEILCDSIASCGRISV